MQSNVRRTHRHVALGVRDEASVSSLLSSSCLSFYHEPPTRECTLPEFEQSAFDRLQVLKAIDNARAKRTIARAGGGGGAAVEKDDWKLLLQRHKLWQDAERDRLSHHVLRLAYCRSEETRRWLIAGECALFRWRFEHETNPDVIARFLHDNQLNYQPIPEDLRQDLDLLRKLREVPFADSVANPITSASLFYRVPFEEAFELVKERRVYLQGGWAYISRANLVHIVLSQYRAALSHALASTFRFLQSAASPSTSDERIAPLLSSLAKQSLGPQYKAVSIEGQVTKDQLPALAASPSFPLCMSSSYSHLKRDHHLKHGGRTQLGLFLKGIGLSLHDALLFWKAAMARKTPADRFDKEYAYNIRHVYGKEGKRVSLGGFGCVKIIQAQPSVDDHCGCPFRHERQEDLRGMLTRRGIGGQGVEEIMRLVKQGDYQIACTRLFALTHNGVDPMMPIYHPNKYFDESRKIAAGEGAAALKAGAGEGGAGVGTGDGAKTEYSATQQVPRAWGGGASGAGEKVVAGPASQPAGVGIGGGEGDMLMAAEEKKAHMDDSKQEMKEESKVEMKEADSSMMD